MLWGARGSRGTGARDLMGRTPKVMKPQDPGVHRLPENVSPVPSINQETPTHSQVESSRPDPSPSLADEPGVNQPPGPLPTLVRLGIPAVSDVLGKGGPRLPGARDLAQPLLPLGVNLGSPRASRPPSVPSSRAGLSSSPAYSPPGTTPLSTGSLPSVRHPGLSFPFPSAPRVLTASAGSLSLLRAGGAGSSRVGLAGGRARLRLLPGPGAAAQGADLAGLGVRHAGLARGSVALTPGRRRAKKSVRRRCAMAGAEGTGAAGAPWWAGGRKWSRGSLGFSRRALAPPPPWAGPSAPRPGELARNGRSRARALWSSRAALARAVPAAHAPLRGRGDVGCPSAIFQALAGSALGGADPGGRQASTVLSKRGMVRCFQRKFMLIRCSKAGVRLLGPGGRCARGGRVLGQA